MTIVELPNGERGWSYYLENEKQLGMFWGNPEVKISDEQWCIVIRGGLHNLMQTFLWADAIRRK